MTATFRPMALADLDRVVELEREIYPTPWSAGVFGEELALDNRVYIVAEGADGVIGYGGLLVVGEDAHITTLAVAAPWRGRRLGTRLMLELAAAALQRGAAHLTLEVRISNEPAQKLYRRFGFSPVGLRKNYYVDEDAVVMWALDIDTEEYRSRLARIREATS